MTRIDVLSLPRLGYHASARDGVVLALRIDPPGPPMPVELWADFNGRPRESMGGYERYLDRSHRSGKVSYCPIGQWRDAWAKWEEGAR